VSEHDITISTHAGMSTQLASLNDQFEQAARQNVQTFIVQNPGMSSFTSTEKHAMIKMEQLKLIGDLTLAEILLRGQVIHEIESMGLWSTHPMGFNSMEDAAEAQGISKSEYSNIRDLCDVIFPYLAQAGYIIADLWETIGKSNFRELVPILKRTITDEVSRSARVEAIFTNEMNDIVASAQAMGEVITDQDARKILVDQLIEAGQLPVRELRQRIRPERIPGLEAYQLSYDGNLSILMVVADDDQSQLLQSRLRGHIDIVNLTQDQARHTPAICELVRNIIDNQDTV
jgi:hypothetical protein